MTREQILKLYPRAGESFLKRNASPVGAVVASKRERHPKSALGKDAKAKPRGEVCVEIVVSLIVCQPNLFDSDNAISGGLKALRDAIAESISIDDGDPRLRWHYGQIQTTGTAGVIVKIERL